MLLRALVCLGLVACKPPPRHDTPIGSTAPVTVDAPRPDADDRIRDPMPMSKECMENPLGKDCQ